MNILKLMGKGPSGARATTSGFLLQGNAAARRNFSQIVSNRAPETQVTKLQCACAYLPLCVFRARKESETIQSLITLTMPSWWALAALVSE